tara:strand:+ start:179 stop:487 length:309 start_codon:yes stop_codon:yes gene_type:complete
VSIVSLILDSINKKEEEQIERDTKMYSMILFLLLTLASSKDPAFGLTEPTTAINSYNEYMSNWIKHQLNIIDRKIPPNKWHETLNAPLGTSSNQKNKWSIFI